MIARVSFRRELGRWRVSPLVLAWCACFLSHLTFVASSSGKASSFSSPVSNWDASWTASSVKTTIVAVSCSIGAENCSPAVLVLIQQGDNSATKTKRKDDNSSKNSWIKVDDLWVLPYWPDRATTLDSSPRWSVLGSSSTFCCMTGLASDVDYLSRVLQKQADMHRILYEGSRIMPTLELVKVLSGLLQAAARIDDGRPYGVQALLIGSQRVPSASPDKGKLCLFTLDPSGGYRHWGSATAIGKDAPVVRKRLYESMSALEVSLNSKAALDVAMRALIAERKTVESPSSKDVDRSTLPEALLIWKNKSNAIVHVATIDPQLVASSALNCMDSSSTSSRPTS